MSAIEQAIILGIIQGLTEFIPVSSSGHLVTIPRLFRWHDLGLPFDVACHWGTLVALLVYFRKDWANMLAGLLRSTSRTSDVSGRMVLPLIAACVPAAVVGFLFNDKIESLRSWHLLVPAVGFVLIGVGFIMLLAERVGKKRRGIAEMRWGDYIVIGIAQALALFPGVSRSGITISAGLFLNLERSAAARFSFLLSTPVVLGAGLLELAKLIKAGIDWGELGVFGVGLVTSACAGLAAIAFLMRYLAKKPLDPFVTYRICFGIFLLLASQ
ncbi:MAG: undecaprenyl-diphosphatase UppP [Armatimonadota bacterium]|nr:undecaprenyl-diphosphatase UppP [Armatimonadota bacterium]